MNYKKYIKKNSKKINTKLSWSYFFDTLIGDKLKLCINHVHLNPIYICNGEISLARDCDSAFYEQIDRWRVRFDGL